jgi:hypothetical protein
MPLMPLLIRFWSFKVQTLMPRCPEHVPPIWSQLGLGLLTAIASSTKRDKANVLAAAEMWRFGTTRNGMDVNGADAVLRVAATNLQNNFEKMYHSITLLTVSNNAAHERRHMPYVKYRGEHLKTMRQVALLVGLSPSRYWRLVRERGLLESPAVQAGRRYYYDALQVAHIVKQVKRLRKAGTPA